MKVLIVGGGGREHALAWAISKSPKLTKLYAAPGNAGIAAVAECLDIGAEDIPGICAAVEALKIGFVVVGPEAPVHKIFRGVINFLAVDLLVFALIVLFPAISLLLPYSKW